MKARKTRKIIRRRELSAAISLVLAASPVAYVHAQNAQGEDVNEQSEEMVMEEVVVTGTYRASLINQIETKRDNTSIVDAISAEDIGKLPDSSVAESLARLPGVSGERRNGRVSGISVRGFKEDYVGTTLNGRELLGMGDNRGVEYDLYPSEIVSGMVVYKTPDATQMVQGIGGIVDIRTNRPLETNRYLAINGTYEQNGMDSANPDYDDNGYRLALSFSDVFADDTVGFSFAAATTKSPSQEEQFRGWGYPGANPDRAADGVSMTGDETILGGHDSFVRSAELQRDTISGVLQWAPSDDVTITLDAIYIDFQEDKVFRGLEEGGAEWGTGDYTITGVDDGFVTDGFHNGFRSVIRNDGERKEAELMTFGLNLEWNLSDNWTMEFDGAISDVEKTITNIESYSGVGRAALASQGPASARSWTMTPTGVMYSPHPTIPGVDLTDFDMIRLAGPQSWGGAMAPIEQFAEVTLPDGSVIGPPQAQDGFVNTPTFEEDLTTLRLDFDRALDWSIFREVTFGVNYSDRSKTKNNRGFYLTAPTWPNDGAIPEEYRVGVADVSFIGIDGVVAYDGLGMFLDGYYTASDAQELETSRLGDSYTVNEKLTTFFAKLDFDAEFGPGILLGNVGLQYQDVDQDSTGYGTYTGPDLYVLATPIEDGDDYGKWLPSMNLTYDFGNGHLLRAAASKTVSRPRMDDMRPNQQVSFSFNLSNISSTDPRNSAWSGSAGNARLRPLEANQFDLAWDWYFADGSGLFSAAFFYKDLVNWHRAGQFVADFEQFYIPGYHQVDDENGDPVTPATFEGLVSYREDGLTGDVKGLELQTIFPMEIVWDKLEGLGFIATATFIDGELDDGSSVPGLSDKNYSLTAYYERGGFEARIGWTKRSEYTTETRGLSLALSPTVDQGATLVDAQIGYDFGLAGHAGWLGGLSLALQGQNLTNEDTIQSNDDPREVTQYQSFGANYLLTAIYKFW